MKILYSINGDGLGHTTRSIPIIEHILKNKKNTIKITTSSKRSYDFIKDKFENIEYYEGLKLFYKKNKLRTTKTTLYNAKLILFKGIYRKIRKIILDFNPDVIITDCDHIVTKVASKLKIPVICICNIHAMSELKLEVNTKDKMAFHLSNIPTKLFSKNITHHIITTFFRRPIKNNSKKNKEILDPIVREEIINAKPKNGMYYLIYQTSNNNYDLLNIVTKKKYSKNTFVIYGYNNEVSKKYSRYSNLFFKSINTNEFFSDLENCKACITNGGHTFITEAIYLKKPIFSIPVRGQYEQKLNAMELEKLGYGIMCETSIEQKFQEFLKNTSKYKKNLEKSKSWNNNVLFKRLDELLNKTYFNYKKSNKKFNK
jgi:uncharacterized protein (TIGR00661 family)